MTPPDDKTPELVPRLPHDLERLIFEDAAHAHRESIPNMMRVCQRSKEWTESILYSVVIPHKSTFFPHSYDPPIEQLSSYAHHVRHLLVFVQIGAEVLNDYLRLCKNLTNVALWCHTGYQDALALLSTLPLRSLTAYLPVIYPSGPPYTFQNEFRGLTYLELLGAGGVTWDQVCGLTELGNLTHLGLNNVKEEQLIHDILQHCPKIRVLALYESNLEDKVPLDCLVVFARFSLALYIRDWIAFSEERESFWDLAERTIREKQLAENVVVG